MTQINMAIISVGSNIEADKNIGKMLLLMEKQVQIDKISEMVNTDPIGLTNQPQYTNGALKVFTALDFDALNRFLKSVEDALGRDRTLPKFGPRTMDLDIVVWNGKIIDDDYHKRDFLKHAVDALLP